MATELARIAHRHRLETLRYLLDLARLEAESAIPKGRSES
jgi:hypothetical protein